MTVRDVTIILCEKYGVSQNELAERIGCARTTIATQLSRNNGMGMRVETFMKILDALDCQIVISQPDPDSDDFLLDGEDDGIDYERNGYRE